MCQALQIPRPRMPTSCAQTTFKMRSTCRMEDQYSQAWRSLQMTLVCLLGSPWLGCTALLLGLLCASAVICCNADDSIAELEVCLLTDGLVSSLTVASILFQQDSSHHTNKVLPVFLLACVRALFDKILSIFFILICCLFACFIVPQRVP